MMTKVPARDGLAGVTIFPSYATAGIHEIRISTNGNDSSLCINAVNMSISCRTLDFVLDQVNSHTFFNIPTKIVIEPGNYILNSSHTIQNVNNFDLSGDIHNHDDKLHEFFNDVVIRCNKNVGLAFVRSVNLQFSYITFEECGSWHNNTSFNHPRFQAALFVAYTRNLTLVSCSIINSPGVGLNMYDVGGFVVIENARFIGNSRNTANSPKKLKVGGGLKIEFTFCGALYPFDCYDSETNMFNNQSSFVIRNSYFADNNAATTHKYNQTFDRNPHGKYFNSIGRGGGIALIIKGNATNNIFHIDNCTFLRNMADWGAGYVVYFQDNACNNLIKVTNSNFSQNTARYAGGAMKYGSTVFGTFHELMAREPNFYSHEDCVFELNTANIGWGGAFAAYGSTGYLGSKSWHGDKTPSFINCTWRNNSATAGAAIGALAKPHEFWRMSMGQNERGFRFALKLYNNTFIGNKIIRASLTVVNVAVFGMGTVFVVFVPIIMMGNITFKENLNTALILDNACAEVHGNVMFYKNQGEKGGAIGIYGASSLVFQPGANLTFKENIASHVAGAVYVKTAGPNIAAFNQTIFQRHLCFFRYFDSSVYPDDWNIRVVFQGNNATQNIGRTLFANTLQFCRFNQQGLVNDAIKSWKSIVFNNHDGQPSHDELEVATEPVQIQVKQEEWKSISPNVQFSPSIQLLDERNHSVYGLIKIVVKAKSVHSPVTIEKGISPYFFVKDRIESLWFNGQPYSLFDTNIISLNSQSVKMTLTNLTIDKCPPGYTGSKNSCVCLNGVAGISRCDNDGKSLYLRKGYWGGPQKDDMQPPEKACTFSVVACPYGYCKCPDNVSSRFTSQCECYFNGSHQCEEGRQGILCSKCKKNLSAVIGSYECVKCDKKNFREIILFFVIITVLVVLVLYFKLDFFSGYLNCWLYTYQMLYLLLPDHFVTVDPFMTAVMNIANMKIIYGHLCIWNGMTELQKISFGYVAPAYMILILIIFIKFFSKRALQGNYFRPFCTILVLSYASIVNVSFKQLRPVFICAQWRVYIAANVIFFRGEHVIHASLAVVAIFLIIVPFPFILADSTVFTRCSRKLLRVTKPLLDVLQSCYHPERSWFAAYYIFCRLIAIILHVFISDVNIRLKILQFFCVAVLLLFLFFKPYKSSTLMKIDAFFLSYLVIISLLAEVLLACSFFDPVFFNICSYCIHILLYVPFLYSLALIFLNVKKLRKQRVEQRNRVEENLLSDASENEGYHTF
ncbi:uncharacterized protein LOC124440529 [Xenia sp. Carnegie-2017]|uniref:uncharacterized protein LOC124440529 n=1 Tax=Xenia sp. Carnegie-2017 TaxID=2897299 RepID=UPI001F03506D|nr:uncharacterized protein LOC124440529 [Xenia sp. Carnegie-2017]